MNRKHRSVAIALLLAIVAHSLLMNPLVAQPREKSLTVSIGPSIRIGADASDSKIGLCFGAEYEFGHDANDAVRALAGADYVTHSSHYIERSSFSERSTDYSLSMIGFHFGVIIALSPQSPIHPFFTLRGGVVHSSINGTITENNRQIGTIEDSGSNGSLQAGVGIAYMINAKWKLAVEGKMALVIQGYSFLPIRIGAQIIL